MCGIFALLHKLGKISDEEYTKYVAFSEKIKHRGPDNTRYVKLNDEKLLFGFHRLSINDVSTAGNQPLALDDKYFLICNGEIYNHNELIADNNFKTSSKSDCEVILHLYKKYGIKKTLELISGYFAFALWDNELQKLIFARDPVGVRALYIGENKESVCICSELKGIPSELDVQQFRPGCWWENGLYNRYYNYEYPLIGLKDTTMDHQLAHIRNMFEKAVNKRFMFDRPFGVFLSGGFDSSIVAALVAKKNGNLPIHSFSIGMKGSTDLYNAQIVAKHIESKHVEVIKEAEQMLNAIDEVIYHTETYDTTTVRASTPMYLLSKYIKENTDIVVVFSGEGSDEASGSYLYFHNAPSDDEFQDECVRLIKDLHYFDCLRCDKSTASNGLEVRCPFLDKEFLNDYMSLPIEWKRPKDGIEKWFIRKAFDGTGLLPDEILWRKKEAFSDGVSSTEKSWYQIIQDHVDSKVSENEFIMNKDKFEINKPFLKESYYYRTIFDRFYPNRANTIPYYWLPKWSGNTNDPSARVLKIYNELDN
jgi:asparagine synthase (glutamine-hydrolysing)